MHRARLGKKQIEHLGLMHVIRAPLERQHQRDPQSVLLALLVNTQLLGHLRVPMLLLGTTLQQGLQPKQGVEQEPGQLQLQDNVLSVLLENFRLRFWLRQRLLARHARLDTTQMLEQANASSVRLARSQMWVQQCAPHVLLIPTVHLTRPSQALCCSSRGTLTGPAT